MAIARAAMDRAAKAYGAEIAASNDAARKAVADCIAALSWATRADIEESCGMMVALMGQTVWRYGNVNAAIAAETFDLFADIGIPKAKAAEMADVADYDRIFEAVYFAKGASLDSEDDAFEPDVEAFSSRIQAQTVRMCTDAANRTWVDNGGSKVRYKRFTNDDKPCRLCQELADRGYVWDTDELLEVHDGCQCFLMAGLDESDVRAAAQDDIF